MIARKLSRLLLTASTGIMLAVLSASSHAWQYPPRNAYTPYYTAPMPRYSYAYPRPMVPRGYYTAPYAYPTRPRPSQSGPTRQQPTSKSKAAIPPPKAGVGKKPANQSVQHRKKEFVDTLLPYINRENEHIRQTRKELVRLVGQLDRGHPISTLQQNWLNNLARRYRVKENPLREASAANELLRKVDVIPASLTLAQAANESAWGRSRFAQEANNLFGIWTYDADKGLKPKKRDTEKKHLVRKFEHAGESIKFYMRMLNSHPAYQKLRDIRAQARRDQRPPNGMEMAEGLERYSARGMEYIELIQQLIRQNRWATLDDINAG